jgi:hypothetical protein
MPKPKQQAAAEKESDVTMLATLNGDALALGTSTRATMDAKVTATDGEHIDTATVDATVTAAGDKLAMTTLESFIYGNDDSGSGVLVSTTTEGVAVGEDSDSTSSTTSFAIVTKGADAGFGLCTSTASGDNYEDAYASTEEYGDITAGGDMEIDTQTFSMALSVGVAVDLA